MSERLQLGRDRTHDGDDDGVAEPLVDRAQALEPLHHASSHMSERVSSSATGCRLLAARVCASVMRRSTVSGASRKPYGMASARSSDSVTLPPCVCHGSRSPNEPRSVI